MNSTPFPTPAGYLEVARAGRSVLLRVIGLGNMNISLTMKDFVKSSLEEDYAHFALDLARCTGMDSTFMGTIVAMNMRVRERDGWLCLLNVSEENNRLLNMLGVSGLVPVKDAFPLQDVETERLMPGGDAARRLKHIRLAHEHLVAVDRRNSERFGAFLSVLEIEMREQEEQARNEEQAQHALTPPAPETQPYPSRRSGSFTPPGRSKMEDTSFILHRVRRMAQQEQEDPSAPPAAPDSTSHPSSD